ncbi:MAG: DUF1553 domain-containing protein [Planctomycetia bacterium]|nr:DUF1553 domain-containing protein [Planctomycetia bacterium]
MRRAAPFVGLLLALTAPAAAEPVAAGVEYIRDVKPLLARHCYRCHGALRSESGLRLDTAVSIRKGGDSGAAIEPGRAGDSLLIEAVTRTETRMPAEGEPLTDAEIAVLRQWIDEGAIAPDEPPPPDPRKHWAFQPPVRPNVPAAGATASFVNPVDAFLAFDRAGHGLAPNAAADKATLLRRVHLDLTGLPPTRDELHAFRGDSAPDAFERVVDRLLDSPQYGERWGRHWMDVWRYSDWAGYQKEVRDSQQHIWRWRDWIVECLNADRGYDRMIVDMLAGDEAAPLDPNTLRATGFLARNWYRYNRNVWLDNAVEHTAKAFLGLTLNCARCHDHMYDPIPQEAYYRLRAFFEPHDVRIDRLPGQPDIDKDGIPRVYDAHADRKTFLFVRGVDSQPKEDNPLSAGVPDVLAFCELKIEPVHLPPAAHNPGLKSHVREETLAAARANVEKATAGLNSARTKLARLHRQEEHGRSVIAKAARHLARVWPSLGTSDETALPRPRKVVEAETSLAVAVKHLETTQAELTSVETRIAADNARYATPPAADVAEQTAKALAAANRASVCAAEDALLPLDRELAELERNKRSASADEQRKKLEPKLAEARKKLDAAKEEAAKRTDYPPLDKLYPATSTGRRLALARWIANPRNPLTPRVAINHIWMHHFGEPLVPTVFDFGLNGKPSVHPALLDWLAVEFMDRGWSMKAMHRLIVTSQAYRMASAAAADDPRRKVDPDNRYVWRANVRRMEAETVRDSVLAVAGALDLARGGPDLDHNAGLTTPRRSLYFRHANEKQMTFLKLFDAASINECYRRSESVVPQQALALANSPLALSQSRLLAAKLWEEAGRQATGAAADWFITAAFEQVLCRPPTSDERALSAQFLSDQAAQLADASRLTQFTGGEAAAVKPSDDPAQRAREDLVHVLLNHNDFVTIR